MSDTLKLQAVIKRKRKILSKLSLVDIRRIKDDRFCFHGQYIEGQESLPNQVCHTSKKCAMYDDINVVKEQMDVLSIMYNSPFVFRGKNFKTFNHVYYSQRCAVQDTDSADKFALESNDPVGWSE